MNRREADVILLALDGISANLETLKVMISNSVSTENVAVIPETDGVCQHTHVREVQTHGGYAKFCDDCGYEV